MTHQVQVVQLLFIFFHEDGFHSTDLSPKDLNKPDLWDPLSLDNRFIHSLISTVPYITSCLPGLCQDPLWCSPLAGLLCSSASLIICSGGIRVFHLHLCFQTHLPHRLCDPLPSLFVSEAVFLCQTSSNQVKRLSNLIAGMSVRGRL